MSLAQTIPFDNIYASIVAALLAPRSMPDADSSFLNLICASFIAAWYLSSMPDTKSSSPNHFCAPAFAAQLLSSMPAAQTSYSSFGCAIMSGT